MIASGAGEVKLMRHGHFLSAQSPSADPSNKLLTSNFLHSKTFKAPLLHDNGDRFGAI